MVSYFVKHPVAANLLMIVAVLLGIISLPKMERETFPEFAASKVAVSIVYPGASALDVDDQICQELDDSLGSVTALEEIECLSVDSRANATLTMIEGGDITQFYNDILSLVSGLKNLPADAEEPAVSIAGQTETIVLLAVSGIEDTHSLIRYSDGLANRIGNLSMISNATVSGITENELKITFDQRALRQYGLSSREVADAVTARSLRQPLGTVNTKERDITLRYADARRNAQDLENLVILQNESGGLVLLSDLASVHLEEKSPEVKSFINGKRAAIIRIEKNKEDDAIDAFSQVSKLIDGETAGFREPFAIDVINNSTDNIRERIQLVMKNTVQGLVLVLAVMWMFFSFREAFWISLALPVSFLGGFFVMSLFGVTINMISLVALLMAVGLIMDDSIVIADNIAKWRKHASMKDAAMRGATQVLPGVVSSFLTTACVFGPLMFLSGQIGAILKTVPVVLLITLAVSLVEAFFILPHHLSHVSGDPTANQRRFVPVWLDRFKEKSIIPLVRLFVSWRYLTVGSVFAILIMSIGLIASGAVKVIGFPATEGDTIEARFSLGSGIPQRRTQKVVDQMLEALDKVDKQLTPATNDGQKLVKRVLVRYGANADVKDNGTNTATITVDLLNSEERNIAADDVLKIWREATGPIPDLLQSNFTQTASGPGGSDLDVQVASHNLEDLEGATGQLLKILRSREDVSEAFQDFSGGKPEARLKLKEFAYTIGLNPQAVAGQLRSAFSGAETDTFRVGFSNYAVRVELGNSVPAISDLEEFPIKLSGGKQVALNRVADIELSTTYAQITRQNGAAIARIIGKIDRDATTSTAISALITGKLGPQIEAKYPGISISIGGATQEQQKTQTSIMTSLLTGLIGVYIILAFQFHSYTLPLIVMISIPFALIGTILGHLGLGIDLAMPSFVGFASLAGVAVNNAILFLAFFEAEIGGKNYVEAAINAVRHRFQPVLLSSTTTFVGLMPIVFESSPQAQTLVPLVVAVAFGLLASTLLVIFVFPSLLAIYFDFASVTKWLKSRGSPTEAVDEHSAP